MESKVCGNASNEAAKHCQADDNDGKARYRRAVALLRLRRFSEASEEACAWRFMGSYKSFK